MQLTGLQALRAQRILQGAFWEDTQRLLLLSLFCSFRQQLDTDFAEFQRKIEHVDRQLATIFRYGFEDCNCLASAVKVPAPRLDRPTLGHGAPMPGCQRLAAGRVHPHLGVTVGWGVTRPSR